MYWLQGLFVWARNRSLKQVMPISTGELVQGALCSSRQFLKILILLRRYLHASLQYLVVKALALGSFQGIPVLDDHTGVERLSF